MTTTIHVDLPHNITDREAALFKPFMAYELRDLDVLYLQEVFVTYTGLCIDATGVRKESHHAYADQKEIFLNEAVTHFREALNDSEKLIELDNDEMYLLIHHPWSSNYWHWMTEVILRVWMVRQETHKMILILPWNLKDVKFVQQSLEGFRFKDVLCIPENKHLLVRNLCLPEVKQIADSYYPERLREIREHYLSRGKKEMNGFGDRLYISRKKATKRKVVNENDVERLLSRYGFNCINNEDLDFNEQASLYSNANFLVSIHGAGLTNMLFMKEKSAVLELHKRRTNDHDWHSLAFWYMSNALGFKYHQQLCEPEDERASFFSANFIVDIPQLEKNVRFMLDI
jgi:capsular polysaccharide biosynthesis protein